MSIATTIQKQLGNRALTMMGATKLLASHNGLMFKIGSNAKRVTHIEITLDPSDTYTVTFYRVTRRGLEVKTLDRFDLVYADNLHAVIESSTGLYLSL